MVEYLSTDGLTIASLIIVSLHLIKGLFVPWLLGVQILGTFEESSQRPGETLK